MSEESRKRRLLGTVISNKMDKTIVVEVDSAKMHPLYRKVIRTSKKYMAHDESNTCNIGDRVRIVESRPMSRRKRWALDEVVEAVAAEA